MPKTPEIYNIRATSEGFRIVKLDEDYNFITQYTLTPRRGWVRCECWAAKKHTCRHREMLKLFQELNRVDTGWMYNYPAEQWVAPINQNRRRK